MAVHLDQRIHICALSLAPSLAFPWDASESALRRCHNQHRAATRLERTSSGISLLASGPDCGSVFRVTVESTAIRLVDRRAQRHKRWNAKAREGRNRRAYPLAPKPEARNGRSRCGERPHARNGQSRVMRRAAAASGTGRRRQRASVRDGSPITQRGGIERGWRLSAPAKMSTHNQRLSRSRTSRPSVGSSD